MRTAPRAAAALLAALILVPGLAVAAGKVKFEPVRAPSKGPEKAKVTVFEIADFM